MCSNAYMNERKTMILREKGFVFLFEVRKAQEDARLHLYLVFLRLEL